ncbi:hypothetical protein LUZ62_034025 [Rhynchospora pubera]|uniref:Uncharacterized protein n=1 Tax=Rhynchospora pubera TaxID=906938 RepID=A0AAV8HV95_9POAL|nr:hypothetical protein LUZ62_034025 [Rhynchospora pubera]
MAIDVQVDPTDAVAEGLHNFMKKKLDEVPGEPFKARPVPIFRLPSWFHEINKEYCEPKIISIGPYHWGKDSLRAMEEYKWSTLRDFLARNGNVGIEMYLREMRLLEAQVRACYSETVNMRSNEFVMMLLLDGCFILEFFLKVRTQQLDGALPASWAVGGVMIDLYLLENQMPFFVLHKLWTIQGWGCPNCKGNCPLLEIICEVLSFQAMTVRFRQPQISCSNIQHLLHLYYCGVLPDIQNDEQAATFFCQFSENFGLDYGNHHFHGLFKDVKRYSELTWHKHRARLVRDYFSSPWSFISVVAASILLILTFIMTYYSAAN